MSQKITSGQEITINMLFSEWLAASKSLERKALDYKLARERNESARNLFVKQFAEAHQISPGDITALLSSL
ncbi:hypothetical protein PkP19E3_17675 [Pseudomonas koreensis]|nr:hypothetical protein PkP19E3_17675 [Pseudomonas koreensis]